MGDGTAEVGGSTKGKAGNYPVTCPLCPSPSLDAKELPAIWKYNLPQHLYNDHFEVPISSLVMELWDLVCSDTQDAKGVGYNRNRGSEWWIKSNEEKGDRLLGKISKELEGLLEIAEEEKEKLRFIVDELYKDRNILLRSIASGKGGTVIVR